MYAYAHVHRNTYWHCIIDTLSHTHTQVNIFWCQKTCKVPTCRYSPAPSLNQSLMCGTCMQQCSCTCSVQACHVHTCMCCVLQHAYVFILKVLLKDPSAYWSVFISMVWHEWSPHYLQAHAVRGLILVQHSSLQAPRSYRLFRVHSSNILS